MATWKRLQQASDKEHFFFKGEYSLSETVYRTLSLAEILKIFQDIRDFVKEKGGINKTQIYEDEQGRQLTLIDNPNDGCCKLSFNFEKSS